VASKIQIVGGGFQDSLGNAVSNGTMTLRLISDQQIPSTGQTVAGVLINVPLDASGNVKGTVYVWPNDVMQDTTSYYVVNVYNANGQLVWGPQVQQILSVPSPYNLTLWIPSNVPGLS